MLTVGAWADNSFWVANDCPRGDLDTRYCDANGDLIADTPTDASELVDPDTLIFAYTPVEDPAVLYLPTGHALHTDDEFWPVPASHPRGGLQQSPGDWRHRR